MGTGGDLIQRRTQSTLFGSCLPMTTSSPSCFPVKHEDYYTRIHRAPKSNNSHHDVVNRIKSRWRNLLRRLVSQRKIMSICGAAMSSSSNNKRLTFHYDAVSYAQNFDEGCHHREDQHHNSISSNKKNNTNNFIRDFKSISSKVACSR
ncbi:hypothetical protein MKX01_034209 [Papaver californicum]|nr:hypothetical protein MKX01_034209 [Papaver californicum]